MPTIPDFTDPAWTDEQLHACMLAVRDEIDRRHTLLNATAEAERLQRDYLSAVGRIEGGEWVAPTNALDAYPEGWRVTHNGKAWVSTTPSNVWEPGKSGWRQEAADDAAPADWVQPSGATDAYKRGDRVTYQGAVWVATIDNGVWAPGTYGWERVG